MRQEWRFFSVEPRYVDMRTVEEIVACFIDRQDVVVRQDKKLLQPRPFVLKRVPLFHSLRVDGVLQFFVASLSAERQGSAKPDAVMMAPLTLENPPTTPLDQFQRLVGVRVWITLV